MHSLLHSLSPPFCNSFHCMGEVDRLFLFLGRSVILIIILYFILVGAKSGLMIYVYIGAAILIFLLGLLFFMWKEAHLNEIKEKTLSFRRYPKGKPLTFFFISDIHRRTIDRSILQQLKGKVDFIIIGGDLGEQGVPLQRIDYNLGLLGETAPVFFVWGNNDYELPEDKLRQLFKKHKILPLRNESYPLIPDSEPPVYLMGVDDFSKGKSDKASAFARVPSEAFKIFVSHNPFFAKKLTKGDGVSLFLSGHTHGGQIRLFNRGLYQKGGWEKQGGMMVLVSNGYGTTAVPLRLGARAETHLITIHSEE
ncbi:Phosphoesterase [Bacillus thermotolerans]|uniref:Phosphoesterase n=2 Tax=Bacillus thermotolerans TaxID=1221996 RepID=A0A0F5HY14_BACTR|nr:Phosphoesterase [Bacillus thermotolerans]